MKFGSSGVGSTALEYPVVPAFSPEIHEYTLYFPDDMKGIYGLVTSVFPGKVMAYFKDCKGNDESVCLNAYEKYDNYAAMDYVVDYGPVWKYNTNSYISGNKGLLYTCETSSDAWRTAGVI